MPIASWSSTKGSTSTSSAKPTAGRLVAWGPGNEPDNPTPDQLAKSRKQQADDAAKQTAAAKPKQGTSLFSKVKNFTNDNLVKPTVQTGEKVGNTAAAGVAGVVGLTTAGVQAAKGNTKGAKQTIEAANKETSDLLDKGAGGAGGYITSKQARSSGGGTKAYVNDFVKPTAQAATDVAPLVLPVGKTAKGASLLVKVARGAAENAGVAGGTTIANEALNGQLTKDNGSQIAKSLVTGAAMGGLVPALHGGTKAVIGDKVASKELARNTATTSLLDKAKKLPDGPKTTTELPRPGEVITPSKPQLDPNTAKALQDTMATVHQPKAALEADAAKQAETEAASKQSEQAAKDAEKATADTKKIDQQLEVYDAKAKDAKDGKLSNVDQVKVKQLKEQKAEIAQTLPEQPKVSAELPKDEPIAKPANVITVEDHDYQLSGASRDAYDVAKAKFDKKTALYAKDKSEFGRKQLKAAGMQFSAEKRRIINKEKGVSDYEATAKTAADVPSKPAPEATASAVPESTSAKPEVAKGASEASSLKDTPAATASEQKANTEPKVSNRKQTEIKATGPEPTVVPIKEPEIKQPDIGQSKLAASTEQKAIDKKLTAGFEGKPEYAKVNVKDQAKAALDLIKTDPERAKRIALGRELPPEHLLPESVYVAIENHALKTKDVDLLRQLATESSLSSEATGMGQRLRLLGERDPDSIVTAMRKLAETRKATVERKTGTTVAKATSEELKQIRSAKIAATPKVTRQTFAEFVDSIRC